MEMERKYFGVMFLLFILLASQEVVVPSLGRVCQTQSRSYLGKCLNDHTCRSTCHTEGFTDGNCRGVRRRCFCFKNC
ncbi:hypothetical protein UlMin_006234 [Ulmus minor]